MKASQTSIISNPPAVYDATNPFELRLLKAHLDMTPQRPIPYFINGKLQPQADLEGLRCRQHQLLEERLVCAHLGIAWPARDEVMQAAVSAIVNEKRNRLGSTQTESGNKAFTCAASILADSEIDFKGGI